MFVIAVLFETSKPDAFSNAIEPNAAASRKEPGCHRFDVCYADDGKKIFLYELYDDEAAFKAHLATPHFATFADAIKSIVSNKRLERFQLSDST